ncbi:MAG TPA: fumarylacetoacetate hydrolase family protein [Stellaceae bacterium]|jgi:2-keto-4-pentenoate hydratase/2-oxohepta-3-ene-1,7-dioic acid hydratase in catechol pathway|nr:fumarylacetoacetate hydrolase family protein [Stellaceae bacterium]
MRFVTFRRGDRVSAGLLTDGDRVIDLGEAPGLNAKSALDVVLAGDTGIFAAREAAKRANAGNTLALNSVTLMAPIPHPRKNVFCVGRNYVEHVAEGYRARGTEMKLPEFPQFFTKPPTAVIGPEDEIPYDTAVTQKLDYEVELGVIIGTRGKNIPKDRALAHVFGYTIINDVTARDLQRRHEQWFKGKGIDGSCPMGPWIVHASAIKDPQALDIKLRVNGGERQSSNTKHMIFDLKTIIESLSLGMTLEPGDVIATGTPSGVGFAMNPPGLLKGGDVIEAEVEGIGILRNSVREVPHKVEG